MKQEELIMVTGLIIAGYFTYKLMQPKKQYTYQNTKVVVTGVRG
mgnify:CR=1 FL=1